MNTWHAKKVKQVFSEIGSSEKGLSKEEVVGRLEKYGKNELVKKKKASWILKFLTQFNSPLIYILFVAMVISFIFDHLIDAYVILAVVLFNAGVGFIQERKAERAIDALKKMVVSYAKVYRDGEVIKVLASQVVPGDVISLEEGDKIPADARLFEMKNFRTQESSLTGESFPERKDLGVISTKALLGDRLNMVFMGTMVVSGNALAVVVATGGKTEIGIVAKSIQEVVQPKMHFNEKVNQLAYQMGAFAIIGAVITFIIGYYFRGLEFFDIFLFTIASLVSGIPEGLPAVLVIVLAIGSRRMAKRNAVIRHLPAVETIGVATIIATDKTGTLTSNSMVIEEIVTADGDFSVSGNGWDPKGEFSEWLSKKSIDISEYFSLKKMFLISILCNKANLFRRNGNYDIVGDPTEVALLVLGKKSGLKKKELEGRVLDDFSFNSELKFRGSLVKNSKGMEIFVVGAFEKILGRSSRIVKDGKVVRLNDKIKQEFLSKAESMARKGFRVLALSYKDVPKDISSFTEDLVNDMVFVGFVGMKDPPRKGIKESIQKARNAGIRIIMKTGDHKTTALAIAREIGLVTGKSKAFTGNELEKLSDKEFNKVVREVDIFARVTPNMKMRIIQVLQEQGEVVAMTGDGVNDAPALKKADIGVAMGIIGTDVARESSEIILTDDNFSSIVNAVEEGRTVFRNVRRTSLYLITTNVAEDVTIIGSLALGMPLLMLPIQLLYLNLVTDGLNDIALAMEPSHSDVLNRKPRNKNEKILNMGLIPFLLITAGLMVVATIPIFNYFLVEGLDKARTAAFVSMSMFQLFNVFNMRSLKYSLFKIGLFSNKWVIYSFIVSFLLMIGIIYLPWISGIFSFVALSLMEFLTICLIASSVFVVGEIYKKYKY
jgi:Ca2+-transporting ATPase